MDLENLHTTCFQVALDSTLGRHSTAGGHAAYNSLIKHPILRVQVWLCTCPVHGMNEQILLGNWKQFKGNIKSKWGKLTEDDLEVADGHREQLIGKLQERYGILKDEAERQMKAFEDFNQTALKSS